MSAPSTTFESDSRFNDTKIARFRVEFDPMVYHKIMHWIDKAVGEVSGLGKVVFEADGTCRVISAFLIEQENSGSTTDLNAAAIAKVMYEQRETPGHLNFWWHSHVNFGVFWSGTDENTIRELGSNGFLVSTVLNKKRENLSAIYIKASEILPEIFIDSVPTLVKRRIDPAIIAQWDAEYDEKCKPAYLPTYPTTPGYWNSDDWWAGYRGPDTVSDDGPSIDDRSNDSEDSELESEDVIASRQVMLDIIEDIKDDFLQSDDAEASKNNLYGVIRAVGQATYFSATEIKDLKKRLIIAYNKRFPGKFTKKERKAAYNVT